MKQIKLVLASASPRREELLKQIGFQPVIMPSQIEENVEAQDPAQVVTELSRQKASEVAARVDSVGTVILGSDTVVSAGGRILGKPKTEAEAFEMLSLLAGGSHRVYTGVTLIRGKRQRTFHEETEVAVYPMDEEEIRDYIACGESMDKAGAYGIQGRFAAYIKGIRGSYTNVMGLPAGRVYQEVKKLLEEQDD